MTRAKSRAAPPGTKADRTAVAHLKAAGYNIREISLRTRIHPVAVNRILDHLDQQRHSRRQQPTIRKEY